MYQLHAIKTHTICDVQKVLYISGTNAIYKILIILIILSIKKITCSKNIISCLMINIPVLHILALLSFLILPLLSFKKKSYSKSILHAEKQLLIENNNLH